MNAIDILFEDFLQTSRVDTFKENQMSKKMVELIEKLNKSLPAEQLELFNAFADLLGDTNLIFTKKAFCNGIKCGVEICSLTLDNNKTLEL